jgi:hypothetical protein
MAIVKGFIKAERAKDEAEDGADKKIKGQSLKEILASTEDSDLFGEYLKQAGEVALAEKIVKGDFDRSDLELLAKQRIGFLEVMQQSKNITDALDTEAMKEMAASSPEFEKMEGIFGPEGLRDALRRHLPRLAITDRARFKTLSDGVDVMKETKKEIGEQEKEMDKLRKEYGISEKAFVELLQGGDAREIAEDIHAEYGFWKKKFTRIRTIKKEIEALADENAGAIREYIEKHEEDMKALGKVLEVSFLDNPTLRDTIIADLRKETQPERESGMAFSEAKKPTKEDIEAAKAAFKKDLIDRGLDFDGLPDAEYAKELEAFSKNYFAKAKPGKKGLWAAITGSMWGPFLKDSLKR